MINKIELSIVIAITKDVENIIELYNSYKSVIVSFGKTYEFIFVLDGDFPDIQADLEKIGTNDKKIKIIRLAKNFGKATALTAGFEKSSGETILTLPAYYQVKPTSILPILNKTEDADMVIAKRWPRVDSRFNQLQTRLLNFLQNFLAGSSFQDLGCDVRAFSRQVVEEVPIYGGQDRFFPVLASYKGFHIEEVEVEQSDKDKFWRVQRLKAYPILIIDMMAVFFLVKFTKKPLRFFGGIGMTLFAIGGIFMTYIVIERLFAGVGLAERPALLLSSLLVVLGVQIFALGLIGELIIFTHAKEMKEYTIAETINENV
jgi:glycosyltransferase involved in cell wall biosynthesis